MVIAAQLRDWSFSRRMAVDRATQGAFFGVSALLFAVSAALTIVWCASMSAMGGMPMPGGWTMSMAWMRMPGQTWPGAAASFVGMWVLAVNLVGTLQVTRAFPPLLRRSKGGFVPESAAVLA
jgi:hypothetical protein